MSELLQLPGVNSEVRQIIRANGSIEEYSYEDVLATLYRVLPSDSAAAEKEMWPTVLAILDVAFGPHLHADTIVCTNINPMRSTYRLVIKVNNKGNPRELHIIGHGEYGNYLDIKIDPVNDYPEDSPYDVYICRINDENATPVETFWTRLMRLTAEHKSQLGIVAPHRLDGLGNYYHLVQQTPLALSIIFGGLSSSLHPSATKEPPSRPLSKIWPTRAGPGGKHKDGVSKVPGMLYSKVSFTGRYRTNPDPLYKKLAHLAVNSKMWGPFTDLPSVSGK